MTEQNLYGAFVNEQGRRCFRTTGNVVLDLGDGIPPLMYNRQLVAELSKKPEPPLVEKRAAGKMHLVPDAMDRNYQQEQGFWAIQMAQHMHEFEASYVHSEPPPDFDPAQYDYGSEYEMTPLRRKILWVMTLLKTEQEVDAFSTAMTSITMPQEGEVAKIETETFQSPS